jgi:hypothetical protein
MKMKCLSFVIVAMVAVSASSAAAEDNLRLGILGGLNFSTAAVSPTQAYELSARKRANLGGFVEYAVTPTLSLEARGMYLQKGEKADFGPNQFFRGTVSIDYLSFPVLLKVKANRPTWKPFLIVGGELAFKTNAKAVLEASGLEEEDTDFDAGVRATDFALDFGGGIEIPSGRISFRIEGLYSLGLLNLVAIPEDAVENVKTRTFLVNAGIGF